MSDASPTLADTVHAGRMDRMYRYQRHVYDITRKYYLFGRDTMIDGLGMSGHARVLDVGCGTGRNLALIARLYPAARLYGLDISAEMLVSARKTLSGRAVLRVADATDFRAADFGEDGFERVVISYALSMIPEWENAIETALDVVAPGGSLHIADFGQQEGLPPLARTMLTAWLARFHVSPRPGLLMVVRRKAEARGMTVETRAMGRGYAWLATCRKA